MKALARNPEIFANLFLIGGGVLFAVIPKIALEWWVFSLFLIGHFVYTLHGRRLGDQNLVVLNSGLMLLDIYAIFIRL